MAADDDSLSVIGDDEEADPSLPGWFCSSEEVQQRIGARCRSLYQRFSCADPLRRRDAAQYAILLEKGVEYVVAPCQSEEDCDDFLDHAEALINMAVADTALGARRGDDDDDTDDDDDGGSKERVPLAGIAAPLRSSVAETIGLCFCFRPRRHRHGRKLGPAAFI